MPQVLRGNLKLLESRCARDNWTSERLASAIDAVERGAKLATQLKDDGEALMQEVLAVHGVVLIAWDHKILPSLIGLLPNAPMVPSAWPEHRFDMVWIVEREGEGWRFSQHPLLLLAGDSAEPIE